MLNKNNIKLKCLEFIKQNKLKNTDLVIGAGSAMVMHGLRDATNDIDASVNSTLFTKFKNTKKYEISSFKDNPILRYDTFIDLHIHAPNIKVVLVDGICCYTLETLLQQKLDMNRDKDQDDIQKIKQRLNIT